MSDFNSSFCFCRSSQSSRNRSLWCTGAFSARRRRLGYLGSGRRAEVHIRRYHALNPGCSCLGFTSQTVHSVDVWWMFHMNWTRASQDVGGDVGEAQAAALQAALSNDPDQGAWSEMGFGSGWLSFVTIWDMECRGISSLLGHPLLRNPRLSFRQRDHGSRSIKIISAL